MPFAPDFEEFVTALSRKQGHRVIPVELRKLVQQIQSSAIAAKGYNPDPDNYLQRSLLMFDTLRQEHSADDFDIETTWKILQQLGPFQNPDALYVLVRLTRLFLAAARKTGHADTREPLFASATFSEVNAQTSRNPAYMVIYNDGLIFLSGMLGYHFAYCFSLVEEASRDPHCETIFDAAQIALPSGSAVVESIVHLIVTYVLTDDPRNASRSLNSALERAMRDGLQNRLGSLFFETMLSMTVAHENGHVYRNHLDAPQDQLEHVARRAGWSREWWLELDADRFATETVLSSCVDRGVNTYYAFAAMQSAFVRDFLVQSAREYIDEGGVRKPTINVGTHPPANYRWSRVREVLEQQIEGSDRLREDLEFGSSVLDGIVMNLLPPLRNECITRRSSGHRTR